MGGRESLEVSGLGAAMRGLVPEKYGLIGN